MRYRLSHDLTTFNLPKVFGFRTDTPDPRQHEIVSRLIDYYAHMKADAQARNVPGLSGIWSHFSKLFASFERALTSGDVEAVSQALLKVCTTPLVSGFASYYHPDSIMRDPRARMFESYLTVDRFISLAEALGAMAPQCPFQVNRGYHDLDLNAVLRGVKSRLPFDIAPPKAGGGAFGVTTVDGVISMSDILAMYVADRVQGVLADLPAKTVCEIGGGTGTLGCYLTKTCAETIMIADLPVVSIIQGYYLMKTAGPDAVHLAGEAEKPARVRIFPYWRLDDLAPKSVGLFVNVDSMPEIDADIARHYMDVIRNAGSHAFLSINQEAEHANQGVVQRLTAEAGGFRRTQRFPYWMIAGYVDELYAITG